MSFFLVMGGIVLAFIIVAVLGMLFLRRMLMPSPLRKGKMPSSGARPWQRARSMASLHGITSWHGTTASGPPQPQAQSPMQSAATLPAAAASPFAPPSWLNQDVPFSQAASAWSQAHSGGVAANVSRPPAPANPPPWMSPQTIPQNSFVSAPQPQPAPQNGFMSAPPAAWNTTPFVSQRQPPEGWEGHTFASWNPPVPGVNDAPARGNTGKFRRNSLLPFADIQQPGTNEAWNLGDQANGAR